MYNQPALRFLVLADFIIDRSLFVLDTPAIMGSRQTAGSVPAPRVEAPSHGSHVTALIAFLAVTGREYHCPHCLSSPFWVLPRSLRKLFLAPCRGRKPSRPKSKVMSCCFPPRHISAQFLKRLMLITIAMGMCLTNGYAVFKVQTHSPKQRNR